MTENNQTKLDKTLDRISEQVDSIAHFVGQTAELQFQTQRKLDNIADKIDGLGDRIDGLGDRIEDLRTTIKENEASFNRRMDGLMAGYDRQQQSLDSFREVTLAQQKTTQDLINLVNRLTSQAG
ncbi:MAG: hypothetical protein AAGD25_29065 [Cyanobacteria bacterium P01_F01_bin.150]